MPQDAPFETLISSSVLAERLSASSISSTRVDEWRVVDCRFDLTDTAAGHRAYLEAHIPGASYAHLDHDLSGPPTTDNGRHPMPTVRRLDEVFGRLGIGDHCQVVAYDDSGGAIASRLWWLLRYAGHQAVCVLDGGWSSWTSSKGALSSGSETALPAVFVARPTSEWLVTLDHVASAECLLDARAPDRYRGEHEPLDVRAGHIPGAINHPFAANLDQRGRFKSRSLLRHRFVEALGDTPAEQAVHYCGSGVTACHNLLAAAHAGLPPGRLYAGSWSEWCADPDRPIALGED